MASRKGGHRPKGDQLAVTERRTQVAALYVKGKSQSAIAEALGIHQSTVSLDLRAVRKDWQQRARADYAERLGEELARLDVLEATCWAAYERSCVSGTGKRQRITEGNTRLLERVHECIMARLRVIGALGPTPIQTTNVVNIDWSGLAIGSQEVPNVIEGRALPPGEVANGQVIPPGQVANGAPIPTCGVANGAPIPPSEVANGVVSDPIEARIEEYRSREVPEIAPIPYPLSPRFANAYDVMAAAPETGEIFGEGDVLRGPDEGEAPPTVEQLGAACANGVPQEGGVPPTITPEEE